MTSLHADTDPAARKPAWLAQQGSALLTDLYQLTMLQSYVEQSMQDTAVFEFFVRRLPAQRNFLVFAGLEQAIDYLENLSFDPEDLDWMARDGRFSAALIDYLAQLRFTGDVEAMPEGTLVFADEPVLRVSAPLPQAQIVETRLINLLHLQTTIASKAARCVLAAPEKSLVDFGMRRAHGAEAALMAARANYLAGFDGTATVLANKLFGVPIFGTMAHSFIQAHDSEREAFEHFARSHPDNTTLLIDTYDTEEGARRVVDVAQRLAREGIHIRAVRLDSGDLDDHARRVRAILDAGGCHEIRIFASGDLDEYKLERLVRADAPIDGFGVGTNLDVSVDAPSIDCVYKLQEYAGRARRKRSQGKATWPGRKQVFREVDAAGAPRADVLTLHDDHLPGEPLLRGVMQGGHRLAPAPALEETRTCVRDQLARLPAGLQRLAPGGTPYPVSVSERLRRLAAAVDREFT